MALELSELRAFLVLGNHLHFGHTAEALHVSQPALTKQMQRLEAKVSGPLLYADTGGVTLTPAGEILRDRARSLMRVPDARLLDTNLAEARWRVGIAWRKVDQSDPLVRNFASLARRSRSAAPVGTPGH
jgi:Bacterial regulatory helix-turn-helix protein, lysR family